jgi:hypothetical protein
MNDQFSELFSALVTLTQELRDLKTYYTNHTAPDYGIRPGKLYSAKEVAAYFGFKDVDSVYNIQEQDLPRRRIGPSRAAVRFLGEDILKYLEE